MEPQLCTGRQAEARAGKLAIGTTGFGIGPAYEDKMARVGLRFDELNNFARFSEKLSRNLADLLRNLDELGIVP